MSLRALRIKFITSTVIGRLLSSNRRFPGPPGGSSGWDAPQGPDEVRTSWCSTRVETLESHLGVHHNVDLRISWDMLGDERISKDIYGYLWIFRVSFGDISIKDIQPRYSKLSLHIQMISSQDILSRYPSDVFYRYTFLSIFIHIYPI